MIQPGSTSLPFVTQKVLRWGVFSSSVSNGTPETTTEAHERVSNLLEKLKRKNNIIVKLALTGEVLYHTIVRSQYLYLLFYLT